MRDDTITPIKSKNCEHKLQYLLSLLYRENKACSRKHVEVPVHATQWNVRVVTRQPSDVSPKIDGAPKLFRVEKTSHCKQFRKK